MLRAGSLIAFSATGQPWWPVRLTILVPGLLAARYLGGTRLGAHLYNLAHSTILPAALVGSAGHLGRSRGTPCNPGRSAQAGQPSPACRAFGPRDLGARRPPGTIARPGQLSRER